VSFPFAHTRNATALSGPEIPLSDDHEFDEYEDESSNERRDRSRPRDRRNESDSFVCRRCKRGVSGDAYGTRQRNHCPHCLWSRHVDDAVGDRAATCGGAMEPIAVWVRRDGEWAIVHRCQSCGTLRTNHVAGDDDAWAMMSLAARPLAQPPFPLETGYCTHSLGEGGVRA